MTCLVIQSEHTFNIKGRIFDEPFNMLNTPRFRRPFEPTSVDNHSIGMNEWFEKLFPLNSSARFRWEPFIFYHWAQVESPLRFC